MSDLDTYEALLRRFDVEYNLKVIGNFTTVTIEVGNSKVTGYSGFSQIAVFDADKRFMHFELGES